MDQSLVVNEIFKSIQGEAFHAGIPCCFIRLTSCPLRCRWCDTKYSYEDGNLMKFDEILSQIESIGLHVIQITGGEPLAQNNVIPFIKLLVDRDYRVLLETSGCLSIRDLPKDVHLIMDLKCPSSGMNERNLWENIEYLKFEDEVKFVIADRYDFDWAVSHIREKSLDKRFQIVFSPVYLEIEPKILVQWILAEKIKCRFSLQLHKYIWGSNERGV